VAGRFLAYGWNVQRVSNANDLDLLREAFDRFKKMTDQPTLIIVDSHIGYGAPSKQDTSAAHGEPLGEEEIRATKKRYGWPEDAKFLVPPEVLEDFKAKLGQRGAKLRSDWMSLFAAYQKEHPELAAETLAIQHREPPRGWDKEIPAFPPDAKGIASRDSSGKVLNAIAKNHPC
jgi:transketolase